MHTGKKSGKAMFAIPKSNKPNQTFKQKEKIIMSSKNTNKLNVPEARAAMNKFKMEAASEVGVPSTYYTFTQTNRDPLLTTILRKLLYPFIPSP